MRVSAVWAPSFTWILSSGRYPVDRLKSALRNCNRRPFCGPSRSEKSVECEVCGYLGTGENVGDLSQCRKIHEDDASSLKEPKFVLLDIHWVFIRIHWISFESIEMLKLKAECHAVLKKRQWIQPFRELESVPKVNGRSEWKKWMEEVNERSE